MLKQLIDGKFEEAYFPTIGARLETFSLKVDDENIKLQISDTAGEKRFRSFSAANFKGANGAILVYDVTNRTSFEELSSWIEDIHSHESFNVFTVLAGSKLDLAKERKVGKAEADAFAQRNGLFYLETSAKDSSSINRIFETLVSGILKKKIKLDSPKQETKSSDFNEPKYSSGLDTSFIKNIRKLHAYDEDIFSVFINNKEIRLPLFEAIYKSSRIFERIINNDNLHVDKEDDLFSLIVNINKEGNRFVGLFKYIHLEYCSIESCKQLMEMMKDQSIIQSRNYCNSILECISKKLLREYFFKKTCFPPVTKSPYDFESNIFKAVEQGKLTSVQYLVEQLHANVETKDKDRRTLINIASEKGHLEVVKYLYEIYHANVETKDIYERTPIINASIKGHFEVVRYLYERCHVDIETKDKYGRTPINIASSKGYNDIVKYLRIAPKERKVDKLEGDSFAQKHCLVYL